MKAQRTSVAATAATGDRRSDHAISMERTSQWAEEAARHRSYAEAIEWLAVVETVGDPVHDRYQVEREMWRASRRRSSR